ncbi:transcriptional regulator [Chryseobacterium lactis]|uniref:Transcriptional regulator n=1 Tax=Chryseobacterium lactis TaxID=1241981 RepID=A0A3G6RHT8_CHRLC|nr:helix-turn-helix transcriptional regulator [Chryseobacterium lactis]AZA82196.1 XRE family transcriptional regulator [Chryseobacterium lactis]AZB02577.1 XRE family transcriptional regulator [Chryseobacterium lactis]PNW14128.1 transcriptional regulator [Chryseobacterium lactis]
MKLLRLKDIINERNLKGEDVAKDLGITTTTLSNLNQGNTFPKADMLVKLAEYFDIDIRELFYPTKPENNLQELFIKQEDGIFKSIGFLSKNS